MGPPSLNGGNVLILPEGERSRQPLQWGRRLSTAEIGYDRQLFLVPRAASMGPPSLNGGNYQRNINELWRKLASMGPPSLNGGNDFVKVARAVIRQNASMGPPSLNGGNLSVRSAFRTVTESVCFNGAAVSQRRKFTSGSRSPGGRTASMGPPSLNGGNPVAAHQTRRRSRK